MSRLFNDAANQYLQGTAPVVDVPCVIACWFYCDDKIRSSLIGVGDADGNHGMSLDYRPAPDSELCGTTVGAVVFTTARTTADIALNTWQHGCALFAAADDRRVLLDNGNKGVEGTANAVANIDIARIARWPSDAMAVYWSGRIAEAAIWDLSGWPGATGPLKADAFEAWALPALAAGRPPSMVPLGLVAYWPLIRDTDQDWVGGYDMAPVNAPTVADHPPQIAYPRPRSMIWQAVAVPVKMYDYRRRRV